ncbi:GGDEF domain-containing protein [Peribacillus acanthi]|uniref:GGDEF domain-containing protein n=1 Tax=Peribacillus acanthi TaxID=2171554 RepID=UPI000D3E620B|nr:GGDEF domain-containing protein [Peribacillus acanthi]
MNHKGRTIAIIVILLNSIYWIVYSYILHDGYTTFMRFSFEWLPRIVIYVLLYVAGKKFDILQRHNQYDYLTECYNRKYLEHCLRKMMNKGTPFTLLVIDLNHFKVINDTRGHLEGDRILRELSITLKEALSKEEQLGRWGGDEFIVISPLASPEFLMERLRRSSELLSVREKINLSMAIGKAFYPYDGKNLYTLIERADQDMYKNKKMMKDGAS